MNAHLHLADYSDEDYIDMEMVSSQTQNPREFEFQMFSSSSESRETTTSPADELFYKGKLLPLHHPPRLQMVDKILQNPNTYDRKINRKTNTFFEESFSTPFFSNTTSTPFESCNISPAAVSCPVSRELNPDEYMHEYFAVACSPADRDRCNAEAMWLSTHPGDKITKMSWTRKLKLIKQSAIGSKLKASRAYIKSWFNRSCSSDKSNSSALRNVNKESSSTNACVNKSAIAPANAPSSQFQKGGCEKCPSIKRSFKKEENVESDKKGRSHRRSFSGVSVTIKRMSSSKYSSVSSSSSSSSSGGSSSSSSSSNGSNGSQEMQLVTRSISTNLEVENPIQAAIAHCKKSHQQIRPRKTVSDLGICSLSDSRITE